MSLTSKTLRNMLMVLVISGFTGILAYVLRIYIARMYSSSEYGLIYALISFFSIMLLFVDLGLFQAGIKKIAEYRAKKDVVSIRNLFFTVFLFQLLLAVVLGGIMYIFSSYISTTLFHSSNMLFFNMMLIWFVTFPAYYLIIMYILSYEKTTWFAIAEFLKIFFILVLSVLLQYSGIGIISVFIAYASINVILFVIFMFFIRSHLKPFDFNFKFRLIYPDMIKYGFFIIIGSLSWTILAQTDTLMITYFMTLQDVGLYQAAIPIASILSLVISPITVVLVSSVTNLWANNKKKVVANLIFFVQKYILIFLLPITFVIMLFSELSLNVIFGIQYLGAKNALVVLTLAYMFSAISSVTSYIIVGIGGAKKVMNIVLIGAVINIIGNYFLIHYLGIVGAAIATLISNTVIFFALQGQLNASTKAKSLTLTWIKTLIASASFLGVILLMKHVLHMDYLLEAAICLVIASIIYVALLFLMKILTLSEFDFVKKIVLKKFK